MLDSRRTLRSGETTSRFDIVSAEAIRSGRATDAYFERTVETLEHADVPGVALRDTFSDEVDESLPAASALGDARDSVHLDTTGSGDFRHIVREVRWVLDARGNRYSNNSFVTVRSSGSSITMRPSIAWPPTSPGPISAATTNEEMTTPIRIERRTPHVTGKMLDREDAVEAAREYADEECVGQFGAVMDVERDDDDWSVRFRTHTYADEYVHRIRINRVGNVFSHEREDSGGT